MSCLSLRNHKVVLPFVVIKNDIEILVPVKVEMNGVITKSSQYRNFSVSELCKGMDSTMFALENLIENGQMSKMQECSMSKNNDVSLNQIVGLAEKVNQSKNVENDEIQS